MTGTLGHAAAGSGHWLLTRASASILEALLPGPLFQLKKNLHFDVVQTEALHAMCIKVGVLG